LQLHGRQPVKEKKKLRKLRKETLKDEEKKLFPEVCAFINTFVFTAINLTNAVMLCDAC